MKLILQQPWLALVMIAITVAISFGVISQVDEHTFHGWLSCVFLSMIPAQIYLAVCLKCQQPGGIARLPQPLRGLAFVALALVVAAAVIPSGLYFVNGGGLNPGSMLVFYSTFSVVVVLWLGEMFASWPFKRLSKSPLVVGAELCC